MTERIRNSPGQFIQGIFRMRMGKDRIGWHSARLTQIPKLSEPVFMLTIQDVQGDLNKGFDLLAETHPEMI
jgi:hypothetical protein